MRRKFKLITAIASLTAAIALLMFGVYAAGTRTVDISGTVSFAATNVRATVTVYTNKGTTVSTSDTQAGSYTFNDTTSNTTGGDITGVNASLGDDDYVWSYLVVITNNFDPEGSSIAVEVTPPATPASWVTLTQQSGTVIDDLDAFRDITTIPAQGSYYWLFTYTVNPAVAPANGEFTINSRFSLDRVNSAT